MNIFRKKDVGLAHSEMKRHLTLRDVILLGLQPLPWLVLPWLSQFSYQRFVLVCQPSFSLSLPLVTLQPVGFMVIFMLFGASTLPGWVVG